MASFEVEVLPAALGEWSGLPIKKARQQVASALKELEDEQRPSRSFRLIEENKRRLYLDDVVVVYLVHEDIRKVWVLEVRPRQRSRA